MENKQFIELKKTDYGQGYADGYRAGSNYRELGCDGCAFEDVEEWEMPCAKCMRNCKDYYRRARND
jgi:hypothetical protein